MASSRKPAPDPPTEPTAEASEAPRAPMAAGRRTGRFVRRTEKGFGFLSDEDQHIDVFVHMSDYQRTTGPVWEQLLCDPVKGVRLSYDAVQTDKGWRGRNVRTID